MKYPILWAVMFGIATLAMAPLSAVLAQDEPGITFECGYTSDIMPEENNHEVIQAIRPSQVTVAVDQDNRN